MVIRWLLGREVAYGVKRGEIVARMKRLVGYGALPCDCFSNSSGVISLSVDR